MYGMALSYLGMEALRHRRALLLVHGQQVHGQFPVLAEPSLTIAGMPVYRYVVSVEPHTADILAWYCRM